VLKLLPAQEPEFTGSSASYFPSGLLVPQLTKGKRVYSGFEFRFPVRILSEFPSWTRYFRQEPYYVLTTFLIPAEEFGLLHSGFRFPGCRSNCTFLLPGSDFLAAEATRTFLLHFHIESTRRVWVLHHVPVPIVPMRSSFRFPGCRKATVLSYYLVRISGLPRQLVLSYYIFTQPAVPTQSHCVGPRSSFRFPGCRGNCTFLIPGSDFLVAEATGVAEATSYYPTTFSRGQLLSPAFSYPSTLVSALSI